MDIPQEQARKLFDEGAILLLTDLPEGSEVGIDGDAHVIRRFSGFKMIPPGIHLITWSSSDSSTAIRHGLMYDFQSRQTLVLKYNASDDQVQPSLAEESGLPLPSDINRDQLRSLDAELAPYPFARMATWRELVGAMSAEDIHRVTHTGFVDSLMESPADQEMVHTGGSQTVTGEPTLSFPSFDVKRSWKAGAVGEVVTRFSKDKSWLWCDVVSRQYGGEPTRLLSDLTLAFIIFVHLHNFSSLLAYKRFLSLCCRAAGITSQSTDVLADQFPSLSLSSINAFFTSFIAALRHHLVSLPDDFFTADLEGTGIERFFIEEITELAAGIGGISTTSGRKKSEYDELRVMTTTRFGWDLPSLDAAAEANARAEADDDDEEGEYAPAVVDM